MYGKNDHLDMQIHCITNFQEFNVQVAQQLNHLSGS
jgi:hypothetical protein